MNKKKYVFLLAFFLLVVGCKEKKIETVSNVSSTTKEHIKIENPWMTPAAKNRNSAAYFKILNDSDKADTLFEVVSNLSQLTELHETYKKSEDMLGMRSVAYVIIPSKSEISFSPGGFHVMLIGMINNLPIDSSGGIELKFKRAGTILIPVVCKVTGN